MNGYQLQAESYRAVLERDRATMSPDTIEDMERNIKIFELLASFQPEDRYIAFDSSMFNDIYKGYVQKVIDEICEDEDEETREAAQKIRSRVLGKTAAILDRMEAREAENYYMTHQLS